MCDVIPGTPGTPKTGERTNGIGLQVVVKVTRTTVDGKHAGEPYQVDHYSLDHRHPVAKPTPGYLLLGFRRRAK